ncbi:MAG TPA: transglycosylase domain-containing protein [Mycobacteriales bacterium]|nr:transglycosylase domain-containing protein [Mycobacteriales bacterium]
MPALRPSRRLPAGRSPAAARSAASAVAARENRTRRERRRRMQVLVWSVVAILVALGAFVSGLVAAPLNYNFQPVPPKSVLLLDSAGQPFATIRSPQVEDPVPGSQIPLVMREAIVAAEDQRFYSSPGIDPIAIARAAWHDLTGHGLQGGSTITQQYVKNVYTGSQRTPLRKLREASLALRLEQHLTKSEILTRYLNTLYLGNGTAGVEAASRFYFGVPINELSLNPATGKRDPSLALARAATLAGMAPAPSDWNPLHDPTAARSRELYVLNRMQVAGYINSEQAGDAYGSALPRVVAQAEPEAQTIAPEFRDLVAAQLAHYGDSTLFNSGGMQVTTTLDLDLQQAATEALGEILPKQKHLNAAVVAVDPRNGDLRALAEHKAGGYVQNGLDLADPPVADITRSSGSTIKPFTLAVALQHGHTLSEGHQAPECIRIGPGYRPCNAEGGAGYYTLETALEQSINTVYAPLAVQVGMNRIVRLAKRAGMVVGHLDTGHSCGARRGVICPSYALGIPVSPLSEADAYGSFVDHGIHHAVRSILTVRTPVQGELFQAAPQPPGSRVMPARIANEVTSAMQGVVDSGTGRAARQPFPVYGKTGTTDHFTDAWFTGCTRTLCITVWMGDTNPHELRDASGAPVYGGTIPAKLFAQTFVDYRALQGSS